MSWSGPWSEEALGATLSVQGGLLGFSHLEPSELLEHVVETMPGGLFVIDDKGRITFWNRTMEEISGYSADEVLGRSCSILEGDTCFQEGCDGAGTCPLFAEGFVHGKRCTLRRKDGTYATVIKHARLLKSHEGRVLGGIETVTDIENVVRLEEEVTRLRLRDSARAHFGLIGHHPSMERLFELVEVAGRSTASVLIQGETGTGKELIAAGVHKSSAREKGPFVRVACAALPAGLLESELFGHVRGAFTGAVSARRGRFEEADGGTLFLDEIGDVPLEGQVKLLRVLQEQQFERVGSNRPVKVDIRVVAATNRDLESMCAEGTFRRDLYYRIAAIPIHAPPLRARSSDIPLLVDHFLKGLELREHRGVRGVEPQAMQRLMSYEWPGNVRELEHAIEYAHVLARTDLIDISCLPPTVTRAAAVSAPVDRARSRTRRRGRPPREAIVEALDQCQGHREDTAASLGVSRMTLWKWMRDLEIDWPTR